jgi:hypothetical protein
MEVRASRCVSAEQAVRVERIVFVGGELTAEGLDLILAIDRYAERAHPQWVDLMAKARHLTASMPEVAIESRTARAA